MISLNFVKRKVKEILRPFLLPLLNRLRMPFEVILPRVENLERSIGPRVENLERSIGEMRNKDDEIARLTRAWLKEFIEIKKHGDEIEILKKYKNDIFYLSKKCDENKNDISTLSAKSDGHDAWIAKVEHELSSDISGRGSRVDTTLRYLQERIEFVRREMMFEFHYGSHEVTGMPLPPKGGRLQPRVIAPDKIAQMQEDRALRLNLGCGHIAQPDFINVDMRDLPGVDVVADVGAVPFDRGSVEEIFSSHLVEHFPQEDLVRRLLPYWLGLLKPKGIFRTIAPDAEAMLNELSSGNYQFENFREVFFGGQEYEGDFHYNMFTPESFKALLERVGFVDIEIPVRGRRNGQCYEFELVAHASASRQGEGPLSLG